MGLLNLLPHILGTDHGKAFKFDTQVFSKARREKKKAVYPPTPLNKNDYMIMTEHDPSTIICTGWGKADEDQQ